MAAPLRAMRSVNLGALAAHALLAGPILGGLAITGAAAFGYMPALGQTHFTFAPWRRLLAEPGLWASLRLTASVGFAAALISLALAFAALARRPHGAAPSLLLASPHSAIAIGLAFLIAPSGWIVRLLSPWATGFTTPPDWATVGDPHGLALILGLVVKETPFLIAVAAAAVVEVSAEPQLQAARALGYGPARAWLLVLAPQLYARIRWPLYAVLAYGLSVVDMALALAPSNPAPLSLLALHGLTSPDLADLLPGEAAALLQLALVGAGLAVWRVLELAAGFALARLAATGRRAGAAELLAPLLAGVARAALALGLASVAALALWAVTWRWPFPLALPESLTLRLAASQAALLAAPLAATLALAAVSAGVCLALTIAWLEGEDRLGRRVGSGLIFLPLLLPQIAFLFGVETLAAAARLDGGFLAVAWTHGLFVFPYVWLTLAGPWRHLDPRYARAASALGAGRLSTLWRVKLPILAAPLSLAFAVGVSVSVAQYLSTLFVGGGRVATLTTEALALASGGDRRLSGVVGLAQTLVPLAGYAGAGFVAARWGRRA
jgi:putative thiamine transport system permease protein